MFANTNPIAKFLKQPLRCNSEMRFKILIYLSLPPSTVRGVSTTHPRTQRQILHNWPFPKQALFLSKKRTPQFQSHPLCNIDFHILSLHSPRPDLIISGSLLIQKMKLEINNTTTATTLFTQKATLLTNPNFYNGF